MKLPVRTLLALASASLCGGLWSGIAHADESVERQGAPSAERTNEQELTRRAHHYADLIGDALKKVDLRPEQKDAVQKIGAELQSDTQGVEQAKTDLKLAIADQLASGKALDVEALQPKVDAVEKAHDDVRPDMSKAFVALHDALDSEQRAKFADALAHGTAKMHKSHRARKVLAEMAKDLSLTDTQKEQIKSVLEKAEKGAKARHAMHQKMVEAFKGDTFDPKSVISDEDAQKMESDRAETMVDVAHSISEILTPEQRTKAGEMLRSKSSPKAADMEQEQGREENPDHAQSALIMAPGFGTLGYGGLGWGGLGYGGGWGSTFGTGFGFNYPFVGTSMFW